MVGTHGMVGGTGTALRRAALLLALFSIVLRLATPSWATTVTADAATGTRTLTICTGVGYETITIDAEGRRTQATAPADAPRDLHHDCLSCCMRPAVALLPAQVPLQPATAATATRPAATGALPIRATAIQVHRARAPPAV